jgi:hypothetical protein
MARSFVGWRDAGYVDRLGREVIATEFFHVFIPIWPRARSMYLFHTETGELAQFEIPRDRRSVILGYLRTPIWLLAAILGAGGLAEDRWLLIAIAVACAALGGFLTFVAGTLHPIERDRRAVLKRVTGIGVPPELMPASMRERARDQLADTWFHEHGVGWRSAITRGVANEILVAIAEYDRSPKLIYRARVNLIDAEGN